MRKKKMPHYSPDVSDWANYRRPGQPASNPKYCYNWAFEGTDRVVLCLWHEEMQQDQSGIFQTLNYRDIASDTRNWKAPQRKRAAAMDHANFKRGTENGMFGKLAEMNRAE